MGLLKRLVLAPIAPVEGLVWLGRTIQEIAEGELNDPAALRARLDAAERAYRTGEIDEHELLAIEEAVLTQLVQVNVIEEGPAHG